MALGKHLADLYLATADLPMPLKTRVAESARLLNS